MAATKLLSDNGVTSGITGYQLTGGNDGTLQLQTTTSGGTATTAMTIDTSQNVGIGTSSPATPLDVNGRIRTRGGTNFLDAYHNATIGVLETTGGASTPLVLATAGTERMRIDISGNVGVGVTPSANSLSGSGYRMLEVGSRAGAGLYCGGGETYVTSNTIYNSGFKYASTAAAAMYAQSNGNHYWYTSTSGTIGTSVNTTPSMQLNPNGNLYLLSANGGVVFNKTGALSSTALTDYEEGTWTPSFSPGSASTANFTYTKVGRLVQITGYINSPSGWGSGNVSISGLPFVGSGNYQMSMLWYNGVATTLAAAYLAGGSATLILRPIGGAPSTFTELSVQMSYITNS